MNNEDIVAQVNEGRQASLCLQWLTPLFNSLEQDVVNKMKASFRTGTHTEHSLAALTAALCSIEDLKSKLVSLANRGRGAEKHLEG